MAEVKWIKIVTDIFDDEKMLLIESLPDADGIIVVWFKLLCLAGKMNNSGVFVLNGKIAYTDEMLATIFRRPVNTVRLALNTFSEFGMIEIIDDVITIPNWEKHQNIDQMEKMKEQNRIRVAKHREKQKLLAGNGECNVTSNVTHDVTVTLCNATDKIREEEKKNKEIYKENITAENPPAPPSSRCNYSLIQDLFNKLCPSLPQCTVLSDARKKAIKARMSSGMTIEHFEQLFLKAEASSFLKGANGRDWKATFDWLIKDANMAKVLGGNYDDTKPRGNGRESRQPEEWGNMPWDNE